MPEMELIRDIFITFATAFHDFNTVKEHSDLHSFSRNRIENTDHQ
jgi:hypothetical protein